MLWLLFRVGSLIIGSPFWGGTAACAPPSAPPGTRGCSAAVDRVGRGKEAAHHPVRGVSSDRRRSPPHYQIIHSRLPTHPPHLQYPAWRHRLHLRSPSASLPQPAQRVSPPWCRLSSIA